MIPTLNNNYTLDAMNVRRPPQFSETSTDQTRAPPGSVWGFKRGVSGFIESNKGT